jgi:hypothetical protein
MSREVLIFPFGFGTYPKREQVLCDEVHQHSALSFSRQKMYVVMLQERNVWCLAKPFALVGSLGKSAT